MGLCLSCILLINIGCNKSAPDVLTIAVAANAQHAVDPILTAYTAATGISCQKIVGSSGKLTALITQGAPYDVFMSADMRYPQALLEDSLTYAAPAIYAYGQLVLWSIDKQPKQLNDLLNTDINHIAIANPQIAPYGARSIQVLERIGLETAGNGKLVYGENVAQAAQFAATGAAEVALIAKSQAMSSMMTDKGQWTAISDTLYDPIAQGAVAIRRTNKDRAAAASFITFLLSDAIQDQLQSAGYKRR